MGSSTMISIVQSAIGQIATGTIALVVDIVTDLWPYIIPVMILIAVAIAIKRGFRRFAR